MPQEVPASVSMVCFQAVFTLHVGSPFVNKIIAQEVLILFLHSSFPQPSQVLYYAAKLVYIPLLSHMFCAVFNYGDIF